ncbi:MAG: SDR family oxidoreductase [Bacilli bacterium]|nr:SDR family oxidoreductase [Bacilli bacterium]
MLAIVTGSAKGIGKELIIKLSEKGYDVIITYNNSKNEAELLKTYVETNYGINADIFKCDISKEEDIISLRDYIINKYGKLDILINNAALSIDNSIDEKTKEEFMKVLEVNVVGTFLVSKYLYKYMDNGIIVNISSTDAEDTFSTLNIDYSASKAGINIITKTMALELKNVRVIGVMPNWTNTESIKEMNPDYLKSELERIGQKELEEPEEVASNILKLVFDNNIKSGEIRRV